MKALLPLFIACCFQFSLAQQSRNNDGKLILAHTETAVSYQDSLASNKHLPASGAISGMEIPSCKPEEFIVKHTAYSLVYSEAHEQAKWVAYELTAAKTVNTHERTDKFMVDPLVTTGSATDTDYEKSGYDRGHLAPAADMGWSETTVAESFYYSNMSPQEPGFNRGIWKKTEELVRNWAIENKLIYVVTGPVLTAGLKTIGPNEVSVPQYYYKVVLDYSAPEIKGIGFIIPNTASQRDVKTFAVSIDSVETVTGIDFFPALPDAEEIALEKTACLTCWSWGKTSETTTTTTEDKEVTAVQCSATTQAGSRCKRTTKSKNGLCFQHGGN